jgi:hypothetical protein
MPPKMSICHDADIGALYVQLAADELKLERPPFGAKFSDGR